MAGVPQRSVLGPLLFLIHVNNLADIVNSNLKIFADNTCLYVTVDDIASTVIPNNIQKYKTMCTPMACKL